MSEQRWTDEQALAALDRLCPEPDDLKAGVFMAGRALLTLEAERDALKLRVAALEAALVVVRKDCGDDWNTMETQTRSIVAEAIDGSTMALRALLVEAAKNGADNAWEDASCYACETEAGRLLWADGVADRILNGRGK